MIKKIILFGLTGIHLSIVFVPVLANSSCACSPNPAGAVGQQGPTGGIGPQGAMGPQGFQGDVGDVGPCCPAGIKIYANLFSNRGQTLSPLGVSGDALVFNSVNAVASIGTSLASTIGEIIILSSGAYQIDYSVDVAPVPGAWSVALFLDGNFINGSGSAGNNDASDEVVSSSRGGVIINI